MGVSFRQRLLPEGAARAIFWHSTRSFAISLREIDAQNDMSRAGRAFRPDLRAEGGG